MRLWLKRVAFAVGWGACSAFISRLWQDSWDEAVAFGVGMCCVTLAVWGAQEIIDRNPRHKQD
ncbi:hypothetical protein ACFUAC_15860 [Streptomyces sp. NPDC057148]|uniref:hypothetical protein n=1 Tax=unclassified Streptomyces TaxID=2593676 RepID=UPI0036311174